MLGFEGVRVPDFKALQKKTCRNSREPIFWESRQVNWFWWILTNQSRPQDSESLLHLSMVLVGHVHGGLVFKSFLANPFNFEFTALISRTIQLRTVSFVTSPPLRLSVTLSLPLLRSKPIVASKMPVTIEDIKFCKSVFNLKLLYSVNKLDCSLARESQQTRFVYKFKYSHNRIKSHTPVPQKWLQVIEIW